MKDTDIPFADSRHPRWKQGRIGSQASQERWVFVALALIWNAVAQPMFWLVALEEPNIEWPALMFAGLFPLIGLGLVYAATVKWLQWRRFGNLELQMDPFPGSLGGDVGGMIEIPLSYRPGKSVDVTLSCINVVVRRGHKKNHRSENVIWRERATVTVEPGMRGSRVGFRFQLPADQPATTQPSNDFTKWVVQLHRKLPGADLDQTFELLVVKTATARQSRQRHTPAPSAGDAGELPKSNVVMERTAEGMRFFYPASRNRGMGLAMLMFGASFGIVPWFLGTHASDFASGDAFSMVFLLVGGFFVVVFGLLGLFLTGFGIYSLFNSLDVRVSGQNVVSTRNFLGMKFEQALQRSAISELRFKINAQQGQGAKAKVHYLLEAVPASGKPICLGDSVKGQPLARRLMKELGEALGHTEWREAKRIGIKGAKKRSA